MAAGHRPRRRRSARRSRARSACSASSPTRTRCSTASRRSSRALPTHVRVRYLLERGRTFNSSGAPQRAVPLFAEALTLAERDKDEFYAVDAAHMLGIAAPAAERLGWNLKALSLAEAATDPRARGWRASLYNNIGWTYFDAGDAKTALDYWQKALAARETMGNAASNACGEVDGRARLPRRRPPRRRRGGAEEPRRRIRPDRRDRRLRLRGAGRDRARARRREGRATLGREGACGAQGRSLARRERSAAPRPARRGGQRRIAGHRRSHESAEAPRDLRAPARGQSESRVRARAPDAVRAAGRGRAVGAGDRQGREQGDGEALSRRRTRRRPSSRSASTGSFPYVQSIGLFRNKAKNIVALSEILLREHGGKVPADREALERLPGVGRKTANVVLNVAFGQPTIAVDTHIFRVANRTGLAPGKDSGRGRARSSSSSCRTSSSCTRTTG